MSMAGSGKNDWSSLLASSISLAVALVAIGAKRCAKRLRVAAKVTDTEGGEEPIHRRQVLEEIFCREGEH